MTPIPPYLSVIIPAYNEARRLPRCIEKTVDYLFRSKYLYEVIVIDDGSTDDTWKVCEHYRHTYGHFFPQRIEHRGKGAAVRAGMLAATGRYRLMMDCDLSTPLSEIDHAIEHMRSDQIIIGSREMDRSRVITTAWRRWGGRLIHSTVTDLLPDIKDTQCGFKMFRDYVARDLFERQTIDSLAFDVEILWLATMRGYHIKEMPVMWKYDPDSRVRFFRDTLLFLWDVANIPARHVRIRLPA
jgi:glycosyltransferase involved in cell wall biosynthesis